MLENTVVVVNLIRGHAEASKSSCHYTLEHAVVHAKMESFCSLLPWLSTPVDGDKLISGMSSLYFCAHHEGLCELEQLPDTWLPIPLLARARAP